MDASTRESGVYSVAAVAFGFDRAVKANREWKEPLGVKIFHMAELHNRSGGFAGASKLDVDKIMLGTIGIIRKYASFFSAVSCDSNLVKKYLPVVSSRVSDNVEMLAALKSIYGVICHLGIYKMADLVEKQDKTVCQLAYNFVRPLAASHGVNLG